MSTRQRCRLPIAYNVAMWPDGTQTAQWLDAARHGDEAAVNQLLDRHRGALRRAVQLRMDPAIAGRIDASDIVQEVLLEASRRLADYLRDPAMPFQLWLRYIARDHLIDAHRRHRVADRRTVDREQPIMARPFPDRSSIDLARELRDCELTPAAAAMRRELSWRFRAALDSLEHDDREILIMRYFEQLSNQQVAAALGVTEPAAGMRHLRALRRLRNLLGDHPSSDGRP